MTPEAPRPASGCISLIGNPSEPRRACGKPPLADPLLPVCGEHAHRYLQGVSMFARAAAGGRGARERDVAEIESRIISRANLRARL